MLKGFIGAALSPSQCSRNPLVLLLPLLFGDLGQEGGPAFLGDRRPFFGAKTGGGRSGKFKMSRACWKLEGDGLPPGVWRSRSVGLVRGNVAVGCTSSQDERMGGASWELNVCTSQGTRARTRHGQRVYLRKLKM